MCRDRTTRALDELARAEERVPSVSSLQLRFRDAAPACGFTGLRLLWFNNAQDAISFLARDFPYLHPEFVKPEEIADAFAAIGHAFDRQEIDHETALERMGNALANADHQDEDAAWALGEFRTFDDLASGDDDSNEGVAARYHFRTGEIPAIMEGDDPAEECEAGIPPITEAEREAFARYLVGPYKELF